MQTVLPCVTYSGQPAPYNSTFKVYFPVILHSGRGGEQSAARLTQLRATRLKNPRVHIFMESHWIWCLDSRLPVNDLLGNIYVLFSQAYRGWGSKSAVRETNPCVAYCNLWAHHAPIPHFWGRNHCVTSSEHLRSRLCLAWFLTFRTCM